MEDKSTNLARKLQLEELEILKLSQKSKQRTGVYKDEELAIKMTEEWLLAEDVSAQDRRLALSTTLAAATDRELLKSIADEEKIAQQDRAFAFALSNGQRYHPPPTPQVVTGKDNYDAISVALNDLLQRGTAQAHKEGSSRLFGSSQTSQIAQRCVSCLEEFHTDLFRGSCGHDYCRECMKKLFLNTIQEEQLYPPRCCTRVVSPDVALSVLGYEELLAFSEKAIEWMTENRLYCAEKTCSKFIPPSSIRDEVGTCSSCLQKTHETCRSLAHPGVDCPEDEALQSLLKLATTQQWKQCLRCRIMVELRYGCNHITCRCGREFCYICGQKWKTCTCPVWHENRLIIDMANRAANEQMPRIANDAARQHALDRALEDLRQHDRVCDHADNGQWEYHDTGELDCEICGYELLQYIFVCTNCQIRACFRCRRNRM